MEEADVISPFTVNTLSYNDLGAEDSMQSANAERQ